MISKLTTMSAFLAIISLSAAYQISTSVIDGVAVSLNKPTNPFVKIGESYYVVENKRELNWYDAFEACRQMNADLVAFEDLKEQKLVSQYLVGKNIIQNFWTAGTDLAKQDYFVWFSTGQPVATDLWIKGEPNNAGGNEHCVEFQSNVGLGLNDKPCTVARGYICKAPQPKTVAFTVW
ncbi:C-type lectin 37Da-like [Drosophila teissieri]|uniref:C-type lectin 37Da-like n=1 Tax=Drosophila teissieri TaxID=7243 RepID=UPI001CBA293E|nr:C-type lectin 37Da-like [Drosophila teissieri]